MKEPNWTNCTEEELWKYIATHLKKNNISTVLVGGAVVSIYTDGIYKSGDLDFVLESFFSEKLPLIMKKIGFQIKDGRHFKHPKCNHLFVEFCSPPAAIGNDIQIIPREVTLDGVNIKIYSPTDCIRDRLASYIHFNAMECLDQAVLVAQKQPFDLKKIRKWCISEGGEKQFEKFNEKIKIKP